MKVSIIIPTLNKDDWYTKQILEDIPMKVRSEYEIILLTGPAGVNKKWNEGVEQAKGEYVWIINNDIVLTEGLDETLIKVLNHHKIACPCSTRGKHKFHLPVIETLQARNIAGWCFMMKKADWIPIDPRLDIWFGDNWIYETFKGDVGFEGLCHHYESKTINSEEGKKIIGDRIQKDIETWKTIQFNN